MNAFWLVLAFLVGALVMYMVEYWLFDNEITIGRQ